VKAVTDVEAARAFWERRYAEGRLYGTQATSIALRLAELFRSHKVTTLLDAGCGSGRDALFYAAAGFSVTGVDLSANALRWAREDALAQGVPLTLLQADLGEASLPLGTFDACVAVHLIHLQPADLRLRLVNRLWQLTRDSGLIAMTNYSTAETGFASWEAYFESNTRIDPKGKLVHFFEAEEFDELLPPGRFEILVREEVDLHEVNDGGPASHREWLVVARKIQAC